MRKRMRVPLIGVVVCLALATAWAVLAIPGAALAEKPDKPPGKDKDDGGADQDLPVFITMESGEGVTHDDVSCSYSDSERRVKAFVGRNRGIKLELDERSSRTLVVTLGDRLPDVPGDPLPDDQPLPVDWSNHPIPELPPGGVTGTFLVADQVNVLNMGEDGKEPNPNYRNATILFEDISGQLWALFWGPWPQPGGAQRTNPFAPEVEIERRIDADGNLMNVWDVWTRPDLDEQRLGAATAFLWQVVFPHGARHYWGAFDVSFAYVAVEEP